MARRHTADVPPTIFVSYRFDDEPYGAALIDRALAARFGPQSVFRAPASIDIGDDFVNTLCAALRGCSALVVVIGRRWLATARASGHDREARGPIDWVHFEIAEAFRHNVRVIPVLLGADMPSESALPPGIARLARCQYYRVQKYDVQRDLDQLTDKIALVVKTASRNPARREYTDYSTSDIALNFGIAA